MSIEILPKNIDEDLDSIADKVDNTAITTTSSTKVKPFSLSLSKLVSHKKLSICFMQYHYYNIKLVNRLFTELFEIQFNYLKDLKHSNNDTFLLEASFRIRLQEVIFACCFIRSNICSHFRQIGV